jgi:hypothetical protein
MPKFQPGQSGNPGGRPKMGELREACRSHAPEAIERLAQLMRNRSPRIQLGAIKELLNRAYGQPPQSMDIALEDSREESRPAYQRPMVPEEVAQAIGELLTEAEKEIGLPPLLGASNQERLARLRKQPEGASTAALRGNHAAIEHEPSRNFP